MRPIQNLLSGCRTAPRHWGALAAFALLATAGCGRSENRLESAISQTGLSKKTSVFPLAGRVKLDNGPPPARIALGGPRILVKLFDASKPNEAAGTQPTAVCASDGSFAFHTYTANDGVEAGKYILTFALLKEKRKVGYIGPDGLQNRYNDPDVNGKKAEFTIDHNAPGKRDYIFDLKVQDQEPVTRPGSRAVVGLLRKGIETATRR